MYFYTIIALVVGGIAGWWFGRSQATTDVNRQWMTSLEEAQTDSIITEEQTSQIIRIQDSKRRR